MKFMKTFAIFIFVQSALFLSACNTGLGDSVDIKGPKVTIESPEARENVPEIFEIRGLVTDDFAVGTVTVELDGTIWQYIGSGWQKKAKGTDSFVFDPYSEWIAASKKSVSWTIKNATIDSKEGGTYTIEVRAIDESGNSSEESTKSRDVIIDKSAPKITISSPNLVQKGEGLNNLLGITDYRDITKVTQFLTGDFIVSGKASEENGIKYVEVLIKEDKEDGTQDDDFYLFRKKIVQSESDRTSGSDIVVDALRSWEIPVTLAECDDLRNLNEKKHILKILTSTGDTAGNDSGVTLQGYACMWKEADIPWIDITLGEKDSPKYVYSGSSILGNAYDATAIQSVNVTIKNKDDSVLDGWNNKQIYSANDDEEEKENNVYFEILSPTDSAEYYLEITATDNKGNVSKRETGWINVVDKTFPSVDVSHTEGGNLFCDANGNFTFTIISKDETKVNSLKMVYITDPKDTAAYSNAGYEKWNDGNIYKITPTDTGKTVYENGLTRKIYENKVTINIFDDLGIDIKDRKLTNQTFVFRVEDNGDGKGNVNALTSTYAIQGDIDSPEIEFTKLEYYSYEGDKPIIRYKEGGALLPAFGERTFVKVYGKISDNSSYLWGNDKARSTLEIKANGYTIQASDVVVNNDGTFVATARSLMGASLVFEGKVTDLGGNTETKKYSFLVDSQTPRVEYISALNTDGFYKAGDTIDIFIRFNKNLNFSEDTRKNTSITLNDGKTITGFKIKDGTDKNIGENDILFEYKIAQGDDTERLTISKAEFSGAITSDGANVTSEIQKSIDEIINNDSFEKNLGRMKNISIVTFNPKITKIEYDDTKDFILTITYDKAVAKGSGDVTVIQQKTENNEQGDGVDRVPAVLSEAYGRTLFGKNTKLEDYYDLTTNGADRTFKADLTSKYVLKYDYDSRNAMVIEEYEKTGVYKLSKNVRAQGVEIKDNIVKITFDSLPCKGAKYKINVHNGFVQDKNGGSGFPATGRTDSYTAKGIEIPVIRINKKETEVTSHTAIQPSTTEFKVDCETPGVTASCSYTYYRRHALALIGRGSNLEPLYFDYPGYDINDIMEKSKTPLITNYTKFPYEGIKRSAGKTVENNYEIGTDDWSEGLEYNIIATATKGNDTEKAYAVAYRTVIEINGLGNVDGDNGLFIIGGDSPTGSNTVQGFPTSWDVKKPGQTRLFTKLEDPNKIVLRPNEKNRNIFYFTSWAITKDYYFMVLRGKMDSATNGTPGEGPVSGDMAQNSWVSYYAKYPINPGGYIKILNGTSEWDDGNNYFKDDDRMRNGTGGDGAIFSNKPITFR
ncbi:MAG: hypothetical protein HDR33_08855 [Treponema sp.]|nr:hypothetical protein [Treponema sp.]